MRVQTALAVVLFSATVPVARHVEARRQIVVQGVVRSTDTKQPIASASVVADGQTASAPTDATGRYVLRLSVAAGTPSVTVRARAIGYQAAAQTVSINRDTATADFSLTPAVANLQEVVVTALGAVAQRAKVAFSVATTGGLASPAPAARADMARRAAPGTRDTTSFNTEEYARIEDNPFLAVSGNPLSTFSVDVDRASYANVRRFINGGSMPPKDAVRIEELINYFPYHYAGPQGKDPVSITTDVVAAPWNPSHRVVRIGLQSRRIETASLPPSNLVFLIDVSGSMDMPEKLPLVKQAFALLVDQLRPQDRVAIVVYAGNAGLVLPSTSGRDKPAILDAITRLEAGGSTAGGAGIKLAYDIAKQNFMREGNNRVILATDGDFNVGVSSTSELTRLIEERRAEGTYLTVLGFGMGNLKDARMEQLADKGNGNYAYVDDLLEAKKTLVHELGATLVTVAKDVKLQVEFNPSAVQAYRLIGYENRLLRNEDFADDKKDAGDMGAGHSVTALYEVIPSGVKPDVEVRTPPSLRYQEERKSTRGKGDELLFVNVRYKPPTDSVSRLMQHPVPNRLTTADDDLRFALAVAGYGMLLRDSPYKGRFTFDDARSMASQSRGDDPEGYRAGFVALVDATSKTTATKVSNR